ncbi:MAG: serine/threonine-protein kinase [Polyangiaceae bacterium]
MGKTLCNKYRLDALIGVGGMASVYKGVHRNGNRVAVKVLHPELSAIADIRERFLREGYVANAVDHPGAVRVLDDDAAEDGSAFLVMELLEGQTVRALWEQEGSRLAPQPVLAMMYQLLDVLAAAHSKGIVHRDIKPDNLFAVQDGRLKVLDFGIARIRDATMSSATRTGGVLGTPGFMPREQALGLIKEIDPRTDLWSVGATMFTLLSGQFVHDGETPEQVIVFTATRPARSLLAVAPDTPAVLAEVVDKALAFQNGDRFSDARTMQDAVAQAYGAICGASLSPSRADALPNLVSSVGAVAPVLSTTGGLSATGSGLLRASPRRGSRTALLAGGVAVAVLAVASAAAVLLRADALHRHVAPTSANVEPIGASPPEVPSPSAPEVFLPSRSALEAPAPNSERDTGAPSPHSSRALGTPNAGSLAGPSSPARTAVLPPSASPPPAVPTPVKLTPPPAVPAPAQPAQQNCDPPWYIDPVTNGRKVKPGC